MVFERHQLEAVAVDAATGIDRVDVEGGAGRHVAHTGSDRAGEAGGLADADLALGRRSRHHAGDERQQTLPCVHSNSLVGVEASTCRTSLVIDVTTPVDGSANSTARSHDFWKRASVAQR